MISFRNNLFFIKFAILFFIVVIFGYWGIDLNSEELYIAFSFFFLVIVGFTTLRASMLLFFIDTVNRKYARLLVNLNRIRLILAIRARTLEVLAEAVRLTLRRVFNLLSFTSSFLANLLALKSRLNTIIANKFFLNLLFNVNYFIFNNLRIRRLSGFFDNSSKFFSISV